MKDEKRTPEDIIEEYTKRRIKYLKTTGVSLKALGYWHRIEGLKDEPGFDSQDKWVHDAKADRRITEGDVKIAEADLEEIVLEIRRLYQEGLIDKERSELKDIDFSDIPRNRINKKDNNGIDSNADIIDPPLTIIPSFKIFVSYSHIDRKYLEEFKTALAPKLLDGSLDLWDDTKILACAKWRDEIQTALDSASLAVLMVSQDFLASPFIKNKELQPLLEKAKNGAIKIFWVLLNNCLHEDSRIDKYQAAHDIKKPLAMLNKQKRQDLWANICRKLLPLVQENNKKSPATVLEDSFGKKNVQKISRKNETVLMNQKAIKPRKEKVAVNGLSSQQEHQVQILLAKRLGFEESCRKANTILERMIQQKLDNQDYDLNEVLEEIALIEEAFDPNLSTTHLKMVTYGWMKEPQKEIDIFTYFLELLKNEEGDHSFFYRHSVTSVGQYRELLIFRDYAEIGDAHRSLSQWRDAAELYRQALKQRGPFYVDLRLVEMLLLLGTGDDEIREHLSIVRSKATEIGNQVIGRFLQSIFYHIHGKVVDAEAEIGNMEELLATKKKEEMIRWDFAPIRLLIEDKISSQYRSSLYDSILKIEGK